MQRFIKEQILSNLMKNEFMMPKYSKWQILFYVSWTVVAIWLVLKVIGVIQTPIWLEYGIPMGGLLLGAWGIYHNLMENINKLAVGFATLNVKFDNLSSKVDHIDKDVEWLKKRA